VPGIDVGDLDPDPVAQFLAWFAEAGSEAVALATASAEGVPSARMVLFKGTSGGGFVFHTSYASAKAGDLVANPRAALVFHWPPARQGRVSGPVERLSPAESDAYWGTRPRRSQLGAWASRQSEPIADRSVLERRLEEVEDRFAGGDVPRPPFWGGFRITPLVIEFWHHRDDRLHDRIRYRRDAGDPGAGPGGWTVERLSP